MGQKGLHTFYYSRWVPCIPLGKWLGEQSIHFTWL